MRPNPIVRVVCMDREKYALADRLVLTLVVKSALLKCTWPQGVQARKKSIVKKESSERPGTAGSSGHSECSTPPIRDPTPSPRRARFDLGPPPLPTISHRPSVHASHDFDNYPTNISYSEHYLPLNPMTSREDPHRRH